MGYMPRLTHAQLIGAVILVVGAMAMVALTEQASSVESYAPVTKKSKKPTLFVTYTSKAQVPDKVWAGLRKYASEYDVRFYDDRDCERYIQTHFGARMTKRYRSIRRGAHRADMWRYCALYREGGVYLDIKTVLRRDVWPLFNAHNNVTVLSVVPNTIYQGILAVAEPHHPVLAACIRDILTTSNEALAKDYHRFTRQFYANVCKFTGQSSLAPGNNNGWFMLKEKIAPVAADCPRDQYGKCHIICLVHARSTTPDSTYFVTRYPDFPWHV